MPISLFNYLGTFMVGATVGLMIYAVARTFRFGVPKWVYPAAIGVSMIAFQIYNDYTWFARTASGLPPSHVVVSTHSSSNPLQVWSYLVPTVDRFAVVDRTSIKRNPAVPGMVIADVILVTRFMPTVLAQQIFDCDARRRADAHAEITFGADGLPQNAEWSQVPEDDPMLAEACRPE